MCAGSTSLNAAIIIVSNTADNGTGSLRAALSSAVNGDTIDATGISGTIILTSGELLITNDLSINGPGPANLAVDGNFPNSSNSVFHVMSGATVSISGFTITNGHTSGFSGGGIYNFQSVLTVSNCTVTGNSSSAGGGIISIAGSSGSARLAVVNSIVSGNSADTGGGIYNQGEPGNATLTIIGIMPTSNYAGDIGGGGIKNSCNAAAFITNSTLSGNSTTGNGGAINNIGVQGNASLTVVGSTLSRNSANLGGGSYGGGGIYNDGFSGGNGTVTLINTTLSGNSTGSRGGGIRNGSGLGGGGSTALTLISSTLSGNSASLGGGIYAVGKVDIGNTILNGGSSGSNISSYFGTVTSWGYNLSSDSGGGFLTNATDQINIDPILGPLQNNGGSVFTHALLVGSPAIDKGKNISGDTTDERGFPRTFDDPAIANAAGGDGTDIGAYEVFELRITAVDKMGDDLRLSFTSMAGTNYELQTRSNLTMGTWSSVPGSIPGNGSVAQTTVTNPFNQPQQFYRIHQLP